MRFRDRPADLRRLRPLRSLVQQALTGTLAFLIPVSAALYFVLTPSGLWPIALTLQIIVIAAFLASYVSYRLLGFWVGTSGIAERGFFGVSRYVPRDQIGTLLLVNTYHGTGIDALPQLFICDHHGNQLLRMRGQFWSLDSMEIVAETLEIPLTLVTEEVSKAELLDTHPGLLYWFERRSLMAATIGAALLALILAMLLFVLPTSRPS